MHKNASIYVADSNNMLGKRFLGVLRERGYNNVVNCRGPEPDIRNRTCLNEYFKVVRPDYVFLTAGRMGGIQANQDLPADLMLDNLQVASNLIQISHIHKVKKLLYIGSSCSYPKHAQQPMRPEMLMTGSLESTNASYATAKLAGLELIRAYRKQYSVSYISVIPANVFGPGDKFDKDTSHVIGALLAKIDKAKQNGRPSVEIWGSGTPTREFIFLDDFIDACIYTMERYDAIEPLNVGSGQVKSIADVATEIKKTVGYKGELIYDTSKPDGMLEKSLDSSKIFNMGWSPKFRFDESVQITYRWYRQHF